MEFTFLYIKLFFYLIKLALPILLFLALIIVTLGLIAGRRESWERKDILYWTFITATTVGYGDIRPVHRLSRWLSILIAFCGLMFTGILVAIAIAATTYAVESRHSKEQLQQIVEPYND